MKNLERDNLLITSFGAAKLARACGLTRGQVTHWKTKGIPKAWRWYLRLAYPQLEVWKHYDA